MTHYCEYCGKRYKIPYLAHAKKAHPEALALGAQVYDIFQTARNVHELFQRIEKFVASSLNQVISIKVFNETNHTVYGSTATTIEYLINQPLLDRSYIPGIEYRFDDLDIVVNKRNIRLRDYINYLYKLHVLPMRSDSDSDYQARLLRQSIPMDFSCVYLPFLPSLDKNVRPTDEMQRVFEYKVVTLDKAYGCKVKRVIDTAVDNINYHTQAIKSRLKNIEEIRVKYIDMVTKDIRDAHFVALPDLSTPNLDLTSYNTLKQKLAKPSRKVNLKTELAREISAIEEHVRRVNLITTDYPELLV